MFTVAQYADLKVETNWEADGWKGRPDFVRGTDTLKIRHLLRENISVGRFLANTSA